MRIPLLIIIIMLLSSFNNGKNITVSSGFYVNGQMESTIQSAYIGGSIANPDKGSSFRLNLSEKPFEVCNIRRGNIEGKVCFRGFKYRDTDYTKPGQYIDNIYIGDLDIPLEQGIYKGGNTSVKSVVFDEFNVRMGEIARIKITIKFKNNKRIDIVYTGKVESDGLY